MKINGKIKLIPAIIILTVIFTQIQAFAYTSRHLHREIDPTQGYVTREAAICEIVNTMGEIYPLNDRKMGEHGINYNFDDVRGSEYRLEIEIARKAGIVIGDEYGDLNPGDKLTREDFSLMVKRMFDYLEKGNVKFIGMTTNHIDLEKSMIYGHEDMETIFAKYIDIRDLNRESRDAMKLAVHLGILKPEIEPSSAKSVLRELKMNPDGEVMAAELLNFRNVFRSLQPDGDTLVNFYMNYQDIYKNYR